MGQRNSFSYADVEKINRMYKCGNADKRREFGQYIPNYHNNRPMQFNSFRQFFDTYTSPTFWSNLITQWVFPPRYQSNNNYQDYSAFSPFRF